jgi:acyl-coenzyme A synthetase/AMP-(fatty) acid ligase
MERVRISNLTFFDKATADNGTVVTERENEIRPKIDKDAYEFLCRNKYRKPEFDFNAFFKPFSEANKAFYLHIPFLKTKLKKGEVILTIGDTTCWSAAMLSALFPAQKIISIIEAANNVRDHSEIAYWFDNQYSNIEIFFCDLSQPLPIEDRSLAFVYAPDILHGQPKIDLVSELIRVAADGAIILLQDSQLTNWQPAHEKVLRKLDCGLVAITNKHLDLEKELSSFNYFDYFKLDEGYLLPNPVLEVDVNNTVKIRTSQVGAQIEQALQHHPAYAETIKNTIGYTLSDEELIVLYWAKKCRSCSFIQKQIKTDNDALRKIIEKLQALDIVQIMPLNPGYVRMQHYFAYQEYIDAVENLNMGQVWKRAVASYADNYYVTDRNDNTFYTYRQFDEVVKYITSTLLQNNISKGDKILLHGEVNFESIGLFWASMQLGIVFIPVNSSLPDMVTEGLVEKYNPKIIFLAPHSTCCEKWSDKIVFFDNDTETDNDLITGNLYFSAWLNESRQIETLPEIGENDLCAILYTSGSTGIPKGVKYAHGQLFQSAVNTVKPYSWADKNNTLAILGLESMASFRSHCFSALVGGTCIIPTAEELNNPGELLACIYETEITCVSTNPVLLNQFLSKKDVSARLAKVRAVICGGSALTTQLKTEFFEKTNKKICNIYGMTEMAGLLICERLNSNNPNGNFIGHPIDGIFKIVDDNNNAVKAGGIGELLIYSCTAFNGYYSEDEPNASEVRQWYATGDLIRMNPDGSFELTGRKKDFMKNARGEIVYFSEIEGAVKSIPFIRDFGLIAFFQNESERAALFIELDNSLPVPENIVEEIKKELKTKIGIHKIPSFIKIIKKIPRGNNGKLLKTELNRYL